MSLLDQILLQLQPNQFQASGQPSVAPNASPAMQPEDPTVTAPTPGAGPSAPVDPTAPPVAAKHGGILKAIANIIAPEPGSFMDSAYKNTIFGAKSGQLAFQQDQAARQQAYRESQAKTALTTAQATHEANAPYALGGTSAMVPDASQPNGYRIVQAPPVPTETERLIDRWTALVPGPLKDLVGRAIKNAQYDPNVIAAIGAAKTATGVATAAERNKRLFAPRGPGAAAKPPAGFIVNP